MALSYAFKKTVLIIQCCNMRIFIYPSIYILKQTVYISALSFFAKYYASVIFIFNNGSFINNMPGTQNLP